MRTTLNIPDHLMEELIRETGNSNKTDIIRTAMEELLASIRRKKLKAMKGSINLDINLDELRGRDII